MSCVVSQKSALLPKDPLKLVPPRALPVAPLFLASCSLFLSAPHAKASPKDLPYPPPPIAEKSHHLSRSDAMSYTQLAAPSTPIAPSQKKELAELPSTIQFTFNFLAGLSLSALFIFGSRMSGMTNGIARTRAEIEEHSRGKKIAPTFTNLLLYEGYDCFAQKTLKGKVLSVLAFSTRVGFLSGLSLFAAQTLSVVTNTPLSSFAMLGVVPTVTMIVSPPHLWGRVTTALLRARSIPATTAETRSPTAFFGHTVTGISITGLYIFGCLSQLSLANSCAVLLASLVSFALIPRNITIMQEQEAALRPSRRNAK